MKNRKNCFQKISLSGRSLFCFVLLAAISLSGCGSNTPDEISEEIIELHEPEAVIATTATEPAARRNLYDAILYESHVSPYTEEYSFAASQRFGSYLALPGDTVKKGEALVSATEDDLINAIEEAEKNLQELTEEFEKYKKEAEESLAHQRGERDYLEVILGNMDKQKPAETIPDQNGTMVANPAFASWKAENDKWVGDYNLAAFYVTAGERELQQRQELYNLDYSYYSNQIRKLASERKERTVISQMDGTVVGICSITYGNSIAAETPVIAVGDPDRKTLVCNYISDRVLTKALDIYVFINGKRYEVTKLDSDDLTRTVFLIEDENNEIPMGAYAVLVIMNNYREQVITVAADALYREGGSDHVYVIENGLAVSKEVKKGMSDGMFVEIISGLNEGEQVVVSTSWQAPSSSTVLERGSTGLSYRIGGEAFLPVKTICINPIENGTTFMERYTVKLNQRVKKGDVIAKVIVESDDMDISRLETQLQRQKERLADLIAENREENQERIEQMQESIREQEEMLANRSRDYNTTEICAPLDGYVESLSSYTEGEIIAPEKTVATIADERAFYIAIFPHFENVAAYGDVVEIEYPDKNFDYQKGTCTAVTLLPGELSSGLGEFILLKPDEDVMANIELTDESLAYYVKISKSALTLFGTKKAVDNVILLPKEAVILTGANNIGYVGVPGEDGSMILTPVLLNPQSGQANKDYYWVIDGLTEGMEVLCSE